jgi:imidazolonepropionase-like amidohydrolase
LNPAKLLHINDRTGNTKKGKDADLVLLKGNLLIVKAKPKITMIDGIVFLFIKSQTYAFAKA